MPATAALVVDAVSIGLTARRFCMFAILSDQTYFRIKVHVNMQFINASDRNRLITARDNPNDFKGTKCGAVQSVNNDCSL